MKMKKRNLEPFNQLHWLILKSLPVGARREAVERAFHKALDEYLRVTPETGADVRDNLSRATPRPSPGKRLRKIHERSHGPRPHCEGCGSHDTVLKMSPDVDVHPDLWVCQDCGVQVDADTCPVMAIPAKHPSISDRGCPECGSINLRNVEPVGAVKCNACGFTGMCELFEVVDRKAERRSDAIDRMGGR